MRAAAQSGLAPSEVRTDLTTLFSNGPAGRDLIAPSDPRRGTAANRSVLIATPEERMIDGSKERGSAAMGKVLDTAMVEQFRRDGLYAPVQVAASEEALRMRQQLEAYEAEYGGPLKGPVRYKSHLLFKWLADFIRSPQVLDPVEDILGPDIMVWSTDWWLKEANSPSYVSWHQDSQYWGLDSNKLVTLWVALSPSTVTSGCMRYLMGSHLGPDLPHRETYSDDNMLTRGQEITEGIDESRVVSVELEPGESSIFAFRIAHASHPNRSGDRRIGLAIRFIPPDARQVRSNHDSAALVRGVDTHGHFELEPEPACDFDPNAVQFHSWAAEERRKILYHGTDWGTDWDTHRT